MKTRALRLSAILLLAVTLSGCIPSANARILRTENDFYYVPPQSGSVSVYTPGDDMN